MTIRDELLALADPADGVIHTRKVLAWARTNRESAVGSKLEWDNRKAADEYRLSQIRTLIEIYVTFPPTGLRSTVSLVTDRAHGGGYRPLQPVLNSAEMRATLVRQILDEVERVIGRYPALDELSPLANALQAQRRMLEAMPLAAD